MMDLLLIHPGNRRRIYQALGEELSAVEPPVWAGLIASHVRLHGISVAILDAEAEDLAPEAVAQRVRTEAPLVAAVVVYGHQPSASSQNMTVAGEIVSAVKKLSPTQKVLLVGGHVAAMPERTLREEAADWVAAGEGPVTVRLLVEALKAGKDLSGVPGLWGRDNGKIFSSPPPPLIQDLEKELPGVAWDLLPMERYRAHNWHCFDDLRRQPYAALYTTLGCPYHCSFCCIQAPFKGGEQALGIKESVNTYRFWKPEFVVSQIDTLVKRYGVRNIKIADEMFVLNRRHVEGICDLLIERGYDLNIWAYARVDTVQAGMIPKLRKAGFRWLAFGIESASERVRDDSDKSFTQEEIFETIRAVREAGIRVIGNYIFGLPEDDARTMQATLDLAVELNCEFANFYCAMAYPGSPLYGAAQKAGWELPERWSGYSQHSADSRPLPTRHLPAREVLRFRDEAFQKYFSGARYLEMVRKIFGAPTEEHIRRMASVKLERAILS